MLEWEFTNVSETLEQEKRDRERCERKDVEEPGQLGQETKYCEEQEKKDEQRRLLPRARCQGRRDRRRAERGSALVSRARPGTQGRYRRYGERAAGWTAFQVR